MNAGITIEATFCFVDIAGYTALTDTHGEHAAADLVDEFAAMVRASIEPSGRLQSLTGDCAFLVFPDPLVANDALSRLYMAIADRRNFPVVRAGLHHGAALLREDRHFGSTVNLAARVAAHATGGQILCTRQVADALIEAQTPGVEIEHQGSFSLKNLPHPVDLYEVVLSGCAREYAIDRFARCSRQASGAATFFRQQPTGSVPGFASGVRKGLCRTCDTKRDDQRARYGQQRRRRDVRGLNKLRQSAVGFYDGAPRRVFGIGPNGAAGTTVACCGLLTPTAKPASALASGRNPGDQRHVSLTQRFRSGRPTIRNLRLSADGAHARAARIDQALARLPARPAGGRCQATWRLALAACLLHDPQLLLLDETDRRVDPKARRDFWEELHALAARGITVLVSTHYMDEAERCHKLGYILYGKLLVQGTAEEVIASQSLTTWEVTGSDLPALAERLRSIAAVEQVAAFGNALHVTGSNRDALKTALAPLMNEAGREWREVEPGLEDVFIHLMRDADDAPAAAETSTTAASKAQAK
jgi:ABC-2 type transport system ATP-binding protein